MEIKNERGIFFINIDHVSHTWVPVDNKSCGVIYLNGGKIIDCTANEAIEVGKMLWIKAGRKEWVYDGKSVRQMTGDEIWDRRER